MSGSSGAPSELLTGDKGRTSGNNGVRDDDVGAADDDASIDGLV